MKTLLIITVLLFFGKVAAQGDSTQVYKKRVLETAEVDFLASYYTQEGTNASVTGGIGDEHLTDFAPTIVVSIPLNADDIITIDAGISSYTSASSSNGNPFDGAASANGISGSPWVASSGASSQDTWSNIGVEYSHSSDSRNTVWNVDASFANEYDYSSIGFGGGVLQMFNKKNTTIGFSAKIYLDTWNPVYPIELREYAENNGSLNGGYFQGVTVLDQDGNASQNWQPANGFERIQDKSRNSYSGSFSFSQILNKKAQVSVFLDLVKQQGWLANPLQRVYFGDTPNYYIGNAASIPIYTSPDNTDVFQLADDIERLPNSRFKVPVGVRFNYYINETFALRTYYRYYFDDWGVNSHTASLEIPIKVTEKFTLYPSYRYYSQTQADYFAPYEENLSTSTYYTSDYDLSKFNANQYGFGVSYSDILTKVHISKFGLKSIDLKYANYKRDSGLQANIISMGVKFVMD